MSKIFKLKIGKLIERIKGNVKYRFDFLRIYFSPFKTPKIQFYIGYIRIGTPYFFPRVVRKAKYVQKRIGFDFIGLGWKTKWSPYDYRHEWDPIWSFVFAIWQVAIMFSFKDSDQYWECWLYYSMNTDRSKSVAERIAQVRKEFPAKWTSYTNGTKETICYWDVVLKQKYLKK